MTNLQHSLEKLYSSLTGELQGVHKNIGRIKREMEQLADLETRIPELEASIDSAEMLLKRSDPNWSPESAPPIEPWSHKLPIPFGSCGRRGMEVLRLADKPMTAREIATQVLRECGQEDADPKSSSEPRIPLKPRCANSGAARLNCLENTRRNGVQLRSRTSSSTSEPAVM